MHSIPTPAELSVSVSETFGRSLVEHATRPSQVDPFTGATVYQLDGARLEFHKSGRTVVKGPESVLRRYGV